MAEAPKGYQRKDSYDVSITQNREGRGENRAKGASQDKIKAELERISQKGQITPRDILELSEKYKDDESIVEEVLRLYSKRYEQVKKRAREVAQKIYRKYQDGDRPLHEILNKMLKYKQENNWSDAEYDEFRRELSFLLHGVKPREIQQNTGLGMLTSRINRALGIQIPEQPGLRLREGEQAVVNEVHTEVEKTRSLHQAVSMQSLTHEDCSIQSITGEYKPDRHMASNHIPALIACMFLPKFEIFEAHMLYASIGNIIKTRGEKKPISNQYDALLYNDIISDPNDVVCDTNSPIKDLFRRFKGQVCVWELVDNLRQGKYYNVDSTNELNVVLDSCRNNLYDNADLAYNRDAGSMLRKILSIFSLRPTVISTQPLYGLGSLGMNMPFGQTQGFGQGFGMYGGDSYGSVPFNAQPVSTLTTIPMVTYNLHENSLGTGNDLRSALNQTIWITEDKTLVPKQQNIIYSKEVLIFYVNRQVPKMQVQSFVNPIQFSKLPLALNTFEKLNSKPINIPDRITLSNSNDTFLLRSVVALKELTIRQGNSTTEVVSGNVGLIMRHRDIESGVYEPEYLLYDPYGASIPVLARPDDGSAYYTTNKPISKIPEFAIAYQQTLGNEDRDSASTTSFFDRASKYGTVFFFAKSSGYLDNGSLFGGL